MVGRCSSSRSSTSSRLQLRVWIRGAPRTSSPLSPCFPSLSLALSSPWPNPSTGGRRRLPELRAVPVKSPPPAAPPGPPLRPRQVLRLGAPPFRRHRRNTASTPAGLRRQFRPPRASPFLSVTALVFTVSRRTAPSLFPSLSRAVSSTRSISRRALPHRRRAIAVFLVSGDH